MDQSNHEPEAPHSADGNPPETPTPAALMEPVYDQLRRVAAAYFRNERAAHTLQPTALVHEAYLRLAAQDAVTWHDESQFRVLAAHAMRHILIDHARRRGRLKRGGERRLLRLDAVGEVEITAGPDIDLLALDEALSRLAELDPLKVQLIELRFFAGLSVEDAGRALGLPRSTAFDHWSMARAWLHRTLAEDASS